MEGEVLVREQLRSAGRPVADSRNVLQGADYRITVLADGLVRLEYSASGEFEDRASQAVVDRAFPPAEFQVVETDDRLTVHTARLQLVYDKRPFSTEGLSVQAKGGYRSDESVWRYGLPTSNLGGTARTLDEADGPVPLEPGLLSREGVTYYDDSHTVLLTDDGWIAPRRPDTVDLYVFAYGRDYRAALRAFYRLTGPQPLLPRFALGNWWSRYHPYSADEYLGLMDRFAAEGIPLSVAVLDMDWHLVDIDPRYGSGWTGYTWNRDLFPDPPAFLAALHERGLATTLNVHPAEGVHAHEEHYAAIARRMGVDPDSELPVDFDPADPAFLEAYLEELHHPREAEGVDFWWVDWQQGGVTRIPGLDPLWLLNHFHFLDSGRNGKRPLTFSRYAGVGSHRYPIGFSGDTVITWESLDFQPYFTATASNVGYGWWSHDVGGHFFGYKDDELTVRWTQLGVFSPITRLHSSDSPFNTREPWRFGERAQRIMTRFLALRHRLVPYLHTMNRRAHLDGEPLVQPMYYDHPDDLDAYRVRNQYRFGDRLLVAPITTPADRATGLGAVRAWLPPGRWTDVFTGLTYRGGTTIQLHRDLDTIPVLAPAGAILPLVADGEAGFGTANPEALELRVYAGPDGEFTLAEEHDDERWAFTHIVRTGDELRIHPADGDLGSVPATRRYDVVLCGFAGVTAVEVDGAAHPAVPGPVAGSVAVRLPSVAATEGAVLRLVGDTTPADNRDVPERLFALLDAAQIELTTKERVHRAVTTHDPARAVPALAALDLPRPLFTAVVELLLADAG
ncbi:glycoside hydrolase family 31 protein [Pseudonocardia charpentierae]|uniref:Glycoside hydrolase family 31 protein n=1 Tax=Pseudonocardia charpentierae TaxID=3075545 RepID=A0ABU2N6U9_9PSEU|nr:TIM-barrel domain-containing protein [Pseudonocardia sp. DSM 45834]MDT0349609.1 glycoside hydrolase family 31 protein [Pseudonocardia sp. DSM 45834]